MVISCSISLACCGKIRKFTPYGSEGFLEFWIGRDQVMACGINMVTIFDECAS